MEDGKLDFTEGNEDNEGTDFRLQVSGCPAGGVRKTPT
jgi:hypothetical protein